MGLQTGRSLNNFSWSNCNHCLTMTETNGIYRIVEHCSMNGSNYIIESYICTVRFMTTIVIRNMSARSSRRTSASNGADNLSRMTSFSSNSPCVITMTYRSNEWPRSNTGYNHTLLLQSLLSLFNQLQLHCVALFQILVWYTVITAGLKSVEISIFKEIVKFGDSCTNHLCLSGPIGQI